jgi:hypothetical protein
LRTFVDLGFHQAIVIGGIGRHARLHEPFAPRLSETQHDSYDAFVSGIFFGVAGARWCLSSPSSWHHFVPVRNGTRPNPGS